MIGLDYMKIFKNKFDFILPILSGLLMALYPLFDFGYLVWISLIPLFCFISLKSTTHKRAFIGGTITGAIFLGAVLKWLFDTAPFEWLGVKSENSLVLTFFIFLVLWFIQAIFLGLFTGAFSWIAKKTFVSKFGNSLWVLLIVPSIWIIFEYLKIWGFNILWLGKETLFGAHWTFSNMAYALHSNSALIQIADIGGIYLVEFLIILINTFLFFIVYNLKNKNFHKKLLTATIIVILIMVFWRGYGIYKLKSIENGSQIKIALLQTNFVSSNDFNAYNRMDVFDVIKKIFQDPKNFKEKPDLVIAPEGFGIISMSGSKEIAKYILKDFWKPGQIFLENQKIVDENEKVKSRLLYYDLDQEKPIAFYDKMFLMPNGDYLPYITKLFLNIYSFDLDLRGKFFERGEYPYVAKTQKGNLGGSICTGFLSLSMNRKMTNDGAEILISVSSDAPFHGSKTLLNQNLAISQFRAVENNRYFAQATNMGYSFLINSRGQIINISEKFGNEILFPEAKLIDKKTIYTQFGDWIMVFAIIILIFVFLILSKNHKTVPAVD